MAQDEKIMWSVKLTPVSRRFAMMIATETGLSVGSAAQSLFDAGVLKVLGKAEYSRLITESKNGKAK